MECVVSHIYRKMSNDNILGKTWGRRDNGTYRSWLRIVGLWCKGKSEWRVFEFWELYRAFLLPTSSELWGDEQLHPCAHFYSRVKVPFSAVIIQPYLQKELGLATALLYLMVAWEALNDRLGYVPHLWGSVWNRELNSTVFISSQLLKWWLPPYVQLDLNIHCFLER